MGWCPNGALSLLAVAVEDRLILINTNVGDKLIIEQTSDLVLGEDSPTIDPDYMLSLIHISAPTRLGMI